MQANMCTHSTSSFLRVAWNRYFFQNTDTRQDRLATVTRQQPAPCSRPACHAICAIQSSVRPSVTHTRARSSVRPLETFPSFLPSLLLLLSSKLPWSSPPSYGKSLYMYRMKDEHVYYEVVYNRDEDTGESGEFDRVSTRLLRKVIRILLLSL